MIHIAFNIDENYTEQCRVVINSIIANTNEQVHFHILGLDKFNHNNHKITCYGKPDVSIINRKTNYGYITTSACFRLFLADFLPVDKVIYIDCDTIVLSDIKELWETEVKLIAGCIDPLAELHAKRNQLKHYINSGVLVINLKEMRKIDYKERYKYADKFDLSLIDQDIINIAFEKEMQFLPAKWNVYSKIYGETAKDILEARENPAIIHWCGFEKPWKDSVWNKDKWMKYDTENTSGKAIVLTYPDLTEEEAKLLKETNVFKIACNWHAPELKPDLRLTLDNEQTIEKSLSVDDVPLISANYDYPDERVKRVTYLPNRNSSLPSCVDYLVSKGYRHVLLIATNKITNNKPVSKGFQEDNVTAINSLKDCIYIYKYTDEAIFDVPTMKIEEFLKMTTDENLILGIEDEPITQPLLKTLAFSDAYKYSVKTIGSENSSIETGVLLDKILNWENKSRILNGERTIEANGLEITRITGIEPEKKEKEMTYNEMQVFVKENKIPVKSFKKDELIKAIKEFKGE